MFENPELLKASVSPTKYLAQNSTQAIGDKIRASKAKNSDKETINNLEERETPFFVDLLKWKDY